MSQECEEWGEWTFSTSVADEIDELRSTIPAQNVLSNALSNQWLKLHNLVFQESIVDNSISDHDDGTRLGTQEEKQVTCKMVEAVKTNAAIDPSLLTSIPTPSLEIILSSLRKELNEQDILHFCKMLALWDDSMTADAFYDYVIYPMVKEKSESSLCISGVKELAKNKPEKVCMKLLIPLLVLDHEGVSNAELLSTVYPVLPDLEKDALIMALLEKGNFKEVDWLLLQPIAAHLTPTSMNRVIKAMNDVADEFSLSKIFTKFLVLLCKNLQPGVSRDLLHQIVGKNKTLIKREALKYLDT